ncbi:uncharacterized protein C3orf14 homolog [Gymnodraco acuticeps]|uniref:Uncharacterized protein C3orf14 homolog n=1 Tax=Gymnodraco acuticeps TaxID=8218 RepID=A0A6P8VX61_GYMAC|nr:uncharacterized protein C3orf14 homolog [Gymnodraco acuticeps]
MNLMSGRMRYWASVEGSLPAWEQFLLGKGPLPAPGPGHLPRRAKQRASTATDQGLPPHSKHRTARRERASPPYVPAGLVEQVPASCEPGSM